jgi:hypothetical protein
MPYQRIPRVILQPLAPRRIIVVSPIAFDIDYGTPAANDKIAFVPTDQDLSFDGQPRAH